MNIKEIIKKASEIIEYMQAKELVKFVLNFENKDLIMNSEKTLSPDVTNKIMNYAQEIKMGKPLQYITNRQYFMGNYFYVNEDVLIPQPDTEILIEETITLAKKITKNENELQENELQENELQENEPQKNKLQEDETQGKYQPVRLKDNLESTQTTLKILDLCTGSGAIAISLKKELIKEKISSDICASDISEKALKIARRNAEEILKFNIYNQYNAKEIKNQCNISEEKIQSEDNITFIKSNMFENFQKTEEKYDIIVSNPPYIETDIIKTLDKDVQNEPHLALDGGKDGLKFYKIISKNIKKYLKENGYLLMEIGYDQKEPVMKLFENSTCIKDYSGNDRVIIWKNK